MSMCACVCVSDAPIQRDENEVPLYLPRDARVRFCVRLCVYVWVGVMYVHVFVSLHTCIHVCMHQYVQNIHIRTHDMRTYT